MTSPADNDPKQPDKRPMIARALDRVRRYPLLFIVVALVAGAFAGVPATDLTDQYFSSNAFCAGACHVMEATVYKEFQKSKHWTTATGVRPTCADCHISEGLTAAMWDHFLGTKELFALVVLGIDTPEAFEKKRAVLADRERFHMLANDSKHCRGCHVMEAIKPKRKRGQRQHAAALKDGTTCIACHYNLVHKEVAPSKAFLEATGGS